MAAAAAMEAAHLVRFEELRFENSFVRRLPGEDVGALKDEDDRDFYYKHVATKPRQVFGALYSVVRPTPATRRKLGDGDTKREEEGEMEEASCSTGDGNRNRGGGGAAKRDMPRILAYSSSVATHLLHLRPDERMRADLPWILSGNSVLEVGGGDGDDGDDGGPVPYAQCYGGHQFGTWAGQLGDGRAITIMEVVNGAGERYELQLKGAGMTPYSRRADGRAVLRSSIREYVCSEYMHAIGVPTTRALSLCLTGAGVVRDMFYNGDSREEPGAVVCRVAPSFVRFGTFQLPASRGMGDASDAGENVLVHTLLSYMLEYHYPECGSSVVAMLRELARRTAVMIAKWQLCGFVHGVMNTDNMSFIGVTIDYGPFAFLDKYEPFFTPNITDLHNRRYCFQNQPSVGLWNLCRLLDALVAAKALREEDYDDVTDVYRRSIRDAFMEGVSKKLGFRVADGTEPGVEMEAISALHEKLQKLMHRTRADFSLTVRCLSNVTPRRATAGAGATDTEGVGGGAGAPDADAVKDLDVLRGRGAFASASEEMADDAAAAWCDWLVEYKDLSAASIDALVERGVANSAEHAAQLRQETMDATNPLYVPRNYIMQECIADAEKGDYSKLDELVRVIGDPFTPRNASDTRESSFEHDLAAPPPSSVAGKPGVSLLS